MAFTLTEKLIKSKEKIGKTESGIVLDLVTTFGGYKMVMGMIDKEVVILGSGSKSAIAKYMAEKHPSLKDTKIKWDDEG